MFWMCCVVLWGVVLWGVMWCGVMLHCNALRWLGWVAPGALTLVHEAAGHYSLQSNHPTPE